MASTGTGLRKFLFEFVCETEAEITFYSSNLYSFL